MSPLDKSFTGFVSPCQPGQCAFLADFRNDRLRCRAPPAHAAAERVVQCRAPRRSRSSPPTPSPRRATLPVRERWLRERLRGASRRRPQRGRCRFRCRRSVVQGHLGRSRAAGRPDRARGIGLHPAVSMAHQSLTACGQGLDRDSEKADPALDWEASWTTPRSASSPRRRFC